MKKYILYNPLAGDKQNLYNSIEFDSLNPDREIIYTNILSINNYEKLFNELSTEDEIVICGGDGTLNNFINRTKGFEISNKIFYYPCGSGNDFLNDLGKPRDSQPFIINEYIKNLPCVEIEGTSSLFLNGIGYGLDGACCAVGNRMRKASKKKVNYTAIALRLILFSFRPRSAKITVDGKEFTHKKVWLATTMLGRFFGGGMMIAPDQKRGSDSLSLIVAHNCGRLRLLTVFPSIFKGTHTKYKDIVTIYTGREISVEYDIPCDLQIDGETISDVKKYSSSIQIKEKSPVL